MIYEIRHDHIVTVLKTISVILKASFTSSSTVYPFSRTDLSIPTARNRACENGFETTS